MTISTILGETEERIINPLPTRGRILQTQERWKKAYASSENESMLSMHDFYIQGKLDEPLFRERSLRAAIGGDIVLTSTLLKYLDQDQMRIEVQDGDSETTFVPQYRPPITLDNLLKEGPLSNGHQSIEYLQALFRTKDRGEEICKTLTKGTNIPPENIYIWTSRMSARPCTRVAYFYFMGKELHINGTEPGFPGITFGVQRKKICKIN